VNDDFSSQLADLDDQSTISDALKAIYSTAEEVISNEQIASRERLIHLRARATELGARVNDRELRQILWKVRRQLAGAAEPIGRGGKLVFTEAPWLWHDLILKGCTNLLVALPKVGKSRLMTMMVGRMVKADGEFLGRPLQEGSPPVLIVGSDQNQRDWAKCLRLAGLLADDGTMHDCIVGLFHKGCPLHLDEDGIDQIVSDYCEKHPGLLILLDSYHACTSHLALDESSASFADPLIDLQEAISPYNATLIVIHHSNKSTGGGRASQASRGSTALPGAVSQTITMTWAEAQQGPMARRDNRVKLTTEGREGEPVDLLIEQVEEGCNWISHGTGEEAAMQLQLQQIIDGLTQRQYEALRVMCQHWRQHQQGLDAVQLAKALKIKGSTPHTKARTVLVALERRKLLASAGSRQAAGATGGQPACLYRPIDEVLAAFPEMPVLPLEPLIAPAPASEPKTAKRGRRGKSAVSTEAAFVECLQCGSAIQRSGPGRPPKFCSDACRKLSRRKPKANGSGPGGDELGNGRVQLRCA
jgi:hypothetical protein